MNLVLAVLLAAANYDSWYDSVQASAKPTDVNLPQGIPMAIGK